MIAAIVNNGPDASDAAANNSAKKVKTFRFVALEKRYGEREEIHFDPYTDDEYDLSNFPVDRVKLKAMKTKILRNKSKAANFDVRLGLKNIKRAQITSDFGNNIKVVLKEEGEDRWDSTPRNWNEYRVSGGFLYINTKALLEFELVNNVNRIANTDEYILSLARLQISLDKHLTDLHNTMLVQGPTPPLQIEAFVVKRYYKVSEKNQTVFKKMFRLVCESDRHGYEFHYDFKMPDSRKMRVIDGNIHVPCVRNKSSPTKSLCYATIGIFCTGSGLSLEILYFSFFSNFNRIWIEYFLNIILYEFLDPIWILPRLLAKTRFLYFD